MTIKLSAGRPVIEFIKHVYKANLCPLLVGSHGIGKSDMFQQATSELGIELIVRDLSLMEPPDLIGIPMPNKSGDGTVHLLPSFLPYKGAGQFVLEELNRCPSYMLGPCFQLLTARRLNDYALPTGWIPAACINPPDEDYDVTDLDPALLSRFVIGNVVACPREWLRWARQNDVHDDVLAYVEADPDVFSHRDSNPRAWTYVSRLLSHGDTDKKTLLAVVEGVIGPERAAAFFSFLQRPTKPLSATDIISRKSHTPTLQSWMSTGRLDLVEATLTNVLAHLQSATNVQHAKKDARRWKNLGRFFDQLPGDLKDRAEAHMKNHGHPVPVAS